MGDVVRPDFHRRLGKRSDAEIPAGQPSLNFYGSVSLYRVGLCKEDYSSTCAVFKVVLYREGCKQIFPVATLPATLEGRIEANAIASAVLHTLRLAYFYDGPFI